MNHVMSGVDPECQEKGRGCAPFQDKKGLTLKPYHFQYRPTTIFILRWKQSILLPNMLHAHVGALNSNGSLLV